MTARRKMTDADHVWNRACYREGDNLRDGDHALGALLLMHGYIMNGGVSHAFDMAIDEFNAGIRGYEFFDLSELVSIIKGYNLEISGACDRRYYDAEHRIQEHFERMYASHPERFAPLSTST